MNNEENLKNTLDNLEVEAVNNEQQQQEAVNDLNQEPEPSKPPEPSTSELLLPLVSFSCDLMAPNWQIKPEEKQTLSDSYAQVIDKYFPDLSVSNFGIELNALMMTAAIFAPRLKTPRFPVAANDEPIESEDTKAA